jgi:carboxylesterase type B
MKLAPLSILAWAIGAVLGYAPNNITVQTSTGTYTGFIDPTYPRTRQFLSIPFAEPPVLGRRWLPPQKLSPSNQSSYSTRFPPSCPQFVTAVESLWNLNLTAGNLIYNGFQNDTSGMVGEATSEDCLYLAIWAPATAPPAPLPVLLFLTGGGLIIGGVDIPWQVPVSWVERTQSHIVITINYRLGIFGFPNARGLVSNDSSSTQNLGILDMRMALDWARDNIVAFGGDPKRITLWGQSAGAVAADILAFAYPEEPIAQAMFLESGTVFSAVNSVKRRDATHSNFTYVANALGCNVSVHGYSDASGAAELDCMRHVPFAQLVNFVGGEFVDAGTNPLLAFGLIPDDIVYFSNYTARAEAGQIARVPALISGTANEFSSLVPWPANLTAGPDQAVVTAEDVAIGVCPVLNATAYRNRLGPDVPVFRILYAGTYPNLNYYKWLGAYHASDLPIMFGTYHLLDIIAPTTSFEIEVSQSMQDYVLAFATDPYHGPQKLGWQPMVVTDPNGGDLLRFGADGKVFDHINGTEVDGACAGIVEYNPFP